MRRDTKSLLVRLGQEDLNYYEFESPSLDVDVWPIFEALLVDRRVVGTDGALTGRRQSAGSATTVQPPEPSSVPAEAQLAAAPVRPVARDDHRGIFGRYATRATAPADESVGGFLELLASRAR